MHKIFKLVGNIFAIGYIITFLVIWVYQTGIQSYTYIVIGEPNVFIKYSEWAVGLVAIGYLIYSMKKELNTYRAVNYDPLV